MRESRINLKILLASLLLLSVTSGCFAGSIEKATYTKTIYSAFINRDMRKWSELIRTLETSNDARITEQKLDLINCYYGYIGYLLGKKKYDTAEKLIDKGEKLIDEILKQSPKNATAHSFKGSYLGFRIGVCHYKAIFFESDSKLQVNKALELDPANVQALIDKGNMLYYAPRIFGGDKAKALEYFLKGAAVMEKNKETHESWVYLNLLSIIASAYEATGNLKQARLTYEKILRIEPDIVWIRDDLYPKFLAKTAG